MIIGNVLTKRALTTPQREALIFNDTIITYSGLNNRVNRLANGLLGLGIHAGDRVGLLMYNSPEFLETYFALSKIGAVLVPLNTRLSAPEMDYILGDCEVKGFVFGEAFQPQVAEMTFSQKGRLMICTGGQPFSLTLSYEDILARNAVDEPRLPPGCTIREEDLNVIMYTSGTTGYPKGAMLTHKGMYGAGVEMLIGLHYQYPDRCLILGPFFHSGSITPLLGHVIKGICTLIVEQFEPRRAIELIEKYRVSMMIGVTTIMKMLLQVPDLESFNLESWKYAILPGSPLPGSLIIEAHERIGLLCQNLWGMTELCGPGSFMNVEDILRKPDSAGKPYFNVEMRIEDHEGTELKAGEAGEVVVRAPHVMLGYWNRDDDTRATIRDGWLRTGDMGRFDDEGFIYIIDRKKDMLVSGGENVYPAEIERVIMELEGVEGVSVIGVADEKWGEVPRAFIEVRAGFQYSHTEVIDHCRLQLAKYKVPKYIEFVAELPRTPSGKILKRELRRRQDSGISGS